MARSHTVPTLCALLPFFNKDFYSQFKFQGRDNFFISLLFELLILICFFFDWHIRRSHGIPVLFISLLFTESLRMSKHEGGHSERTVMSLMCLCLRSDYVLICNCAEKTFKVLQKILKE